MGAVTRRWRLDGIGRVGVLVFLLGVCAGGVLAAAPHHPLSQVYPMDVPLNLSGQPIVDDTGAVVIDDRLSLNGGNLTDVGATECGPFDAIVGDGDCVSLAAGGRDVHYLYVNESGDTMSGVLDMDGHLVTGLAQPSASSDAVSKGYANGAYLNRDGSDRMNGVLDMDGNDIVNTAGLNVSRIGNANATVDVTSPLNMTGRGLVGLGNVSLDRNTGIVGGNLGVGTVNPAARLHINGSSATPFEAIRVTNTGASDKSFLYFARPSDRSRGLMVGHQAAAGNGTYYENASVIRASGGVSENIAVQPGNTSAGGYGELHLVPDGGAVGIGTVAPSARLGIRGDVNASGVLYVNESADGVGIGTSSPSSALTVEGNLNVTGTSYLGQTELSTDTMTLNTLRSRDGNLTFLNDDGTERLRMTDSGSLGVGTSSPSAGVSIAADVSGRNLQVIDSDPQIEVLERDATDDAGVKLYLEDGGLELMRTSDGTDFGDELLSFDMDQQEAGIGTASPDNALDVAGRVHVEGDDDTGRSAAVAGVDLAVDDNDSGIETPADDRLELVTGGSTGLRVNEDGSVGIGTTSTQNSLDVSGGMAVGSGYAGTDAAPSDGLVVEGDVGVGTSSPSAGLEVDDGEDTAIRVTGDGGGESSIGFADDAGRSGRLLYNHSSDALAVSTDGAERMRVDSAGRVGVNTASPSSTMEVDGSFDAGAGGSNMKIASDGDVTITLGD